MARGELDIALIFGPDTPSDRSQLGSTLMAWIASGSFHWPGAVELPLLLLEHPCIFRSAAIQTLDAAGIPWRVAVTSPSLGGIWATATAGMGLTLRSAAAIPAGLLDVGTRFGLPALPTIGVKILETSPTRHSGRLADPAFDICDGDYFHCIGLSGGAAQRFDRILRGLHQALRQSCRSRRSMRGVESHLRTARPALGAPSNETHATAFFFISMVRAPSSPSRQAVSRAPSPGS